MPLDATKLKNERDVKGRQAPVPGIYHGMVNSVDATFDKHNAVIAELEVLAGKPGDQVGRKLTHMMFLDRDSNDYTDQHLRFALVTGIVRPGELVDEPDWSAATGAHLIFAVVERAGKNKKTGEEQTFHNVGDFGLALWSVTNPDVADVPKHEQALAVLRGHDGNGATAAPGSGNKWANV